MAANTILEIREENDVAGTTEGLTAPVATGKRAIVKYFGAAIPGTGIVDLHFGDAGGGWEYIRSIANGTYEFANLNEDYIGNGTKMFRVTRTKIGGAGPLGIKTWFIAFQIN